MIVLLKFIVISNVALSLKEQKNQKSLIAHFAYSYIYIFIAIALDESIILDVLHFPMKNIKSRDLEATPMGKATSKPIQ